MTEPTSNSRTGAAEPVENPLAAAFGCLMMVLLAVVGLPAAGVAAYYWYTWPDQATVAFHWNLSAASAPQTEPTSVGVSGTYIDRMNAGDSQLIDFTVRSSGLSPNTERTLTLRIVGAGLVVEPPNGYVVRLSGTSERHYLFSVSANGSGQKAGLVYGTLWNGVDAPLESGGFGSAGNYPFSITVNPETTFGLRPTTWTVINIVALILITIIAGMAAFAARSVGWLWNMGWKVYDNRERIDQFFNSPKT